MKTLLTKELKEKLTMSAKETFGKEATLMLVEEKMIQDTDYCTYVLKLNKMARVWFEFTIRNSVINVFSVNCVESVFFANKYCVSNWMNFLKSIECIVGE